MSNKEQTPPDVGQKPARQRDADQAARHRAIRERFQREKPSLEHLVSTGEYNESLPMGEYLSIRQAVFALRMAREQAGLSLADVTERTGIDKAALSRIETGQNPNPTVSTLCRYAEALGKRWVWGLEDASQRTEDASARPAMTGRGPMTDEESSTPRAKNGKSAAALAAQIRTIQEILAQRAKQMPPPATRVTQPVEGGVEIREKRYMVHFSDAFEANMTDLPPDGENPVILLLERIQDRGEDGAVELLNVLINRGEAQRMALKIFEATEMREADRAGGGAMTVRELLGLIAHYAIEGSTEADAEVAVEVWHEDDTGECYPATMVSGHVTEKTLTIYARGDLREGEGPPPQEGGDQP